MMMMMMMTIVIIITIIIMTFHYILMNTKNCDFSGFKMYDRVKTRPERSFCKPIRQFINTPLKTQYVHVQGRSHHKHYTKFPAHCSLTL
jgi:hypothetical protein